LKEMRSRSRSMPRILTLISWPSCSTSWGWRLWGTVRSLTAQGMEFIQRRVREMAVHVAAANRCQVEVDFPGTGYPPTINDAGAWRMARSVAAQLLGDDGVAEMPPFMGAEDFAFYLQRVPGCFLGLGVRNEAVGAVHPVHHPRFRLDEAALPIGAALHAALAVQALAELG
ncbi:MAG: M20/M25/M40 family metallo-hydrolase, partial [Limnochordales bacterium]